MSPITLRTMPVDGAEITIITFDLPAETFLPDSLAECDHLVGLDTVARQTFFTAPSANTHALKKAIASAFGDRPPATAFVDQPPANGAVMSCEMWAVNATLPLSRTHQMTWVDTPSARWGFVAGTTAGTPDPFGDGVEAMLRASHRDMRAEGMEFTDTVRTWYYIGDILGPAGNETRYDRFNAARNRFYRDKWPDLCRTPASTGIGTEADSVAFEALLVRPSDDRMEVKWIDNPLQTPPYQYDINVAQARKPSFSRAAAVSLDNDVMTFISGTASIRQSMVLEPDDAVAQTQITIENMAALVGGSIGDLQTMRVYIKRPTDVEAVLACCRANLPEIPCCCLIGDVCKSDCLVEIEAVHLMGTPAPERSTTSSVAGSENSA